MVWCRCGGRSGATDPTLPAGGLVVPHDDVIRRDRPLGTISEGQAVTWRPMADHTAQRRPPTLVLLRHGESTANAAGVFSGRWDVPLSQRGRQQARHAARLVAGAALVPDLIITSPLRRATQTIELMVEEFARPEMDRIVSPELTERAYGALTGLPKTAVGSIFGGEQSHFWRRSMTGRPPRLDDIVALLSDRPAQALADLERLRHALPDAAEAAAQTSESLADVVSRVRTWAATVLTPQLRSGRSVLVVAHGNSLRALITVLDALDASQTEALNIPTGEPLLYTVDEHGVPAAGSSRYLDPVSAEAAARAVSAEGGT